MSYAQNQHQAGLVSDIQNWLRDSPAGPASLKWLLLDGAVLGEKTMRKIVRMFPDRSCHNIFAGTPFARYALLSPHFVQVSDGPEAARRIATILKLTDGVPAISLLDGSADGQMLGRYLSWLGQARTEDGMELYCRFADTRVTPSLMRTLAASQCVVLRQCIHEWRIVDRRGGLHTVLTNGVQDSAQMTSGRNINAIEQFCLTDEQFSTMMKAAEADEIFQMLCEGASDLVPDDGRGDFHFRLSHLVDAAHRCGLEKGKDIYQFSVIGLTAGEAFYLAAELDECWARIHARSDDFGSVVASWSDETWEAISHKSELCRSEYSTRGERHEA